MATILLVYCLRQANLTELRDAWRAVEWSWLVAAVAINTAILVSWAGLWWTLAPRAERPSYRKMLEINAMASALMNTIPFLGGHAATALLLIKRGRLSQHGALSVMALDQLGEGMAKVTIFAIVAATASIPLWMRAGIDAAVIAVVVLLIVLLFVAHHPIPAQASSNRATFATRAGLSIAEWATRLETLRDVRQSTIAFLFAIGTKVAEGAGLLAVQHAFGVDLSVSATTLVLAAVVLGSMLPVAPANVGTYEAAAFLAYRHLGLDAPTATMLAVAGHVCFLIPSVGIGYLLGSATFASIELAPRAGDLPIDHTRI